MGEQVERMVPWERRMGQRGWEARDCEGGAGWRRDGGHQSRPPIAAWDRTRRHWGPDLSFFAIKINGNLSMATRTFFMATLVMLG